MSYESPIQMIASEMEMQISKDCIKAVQKYGFNVDEYELARALSYDRHQYTTGFLDALREVAIIYENNDYCSYGFQMAIKDYLVTHGIMNKEDNSHDN